MIRVSWIVTLLLPTGVYGCYWNRAVGPGVTVAHVSVTRSATRPRGTNCGLDVSYSDFLSAGVYVGERQTSFLLLLSPDVHGAWQEVMRLGDVSAMGAVKNTFSVVPLLGLWAADGENQIVYGFSLDFGRRIWYKNKKRCSFFNTVRLGLLGSDDTGVTSVIFARFGLVWEWW